MIQELFQKWIPIDNLGIAYDVEDITLGDGISFTLVADKKRITPTLHFDLEFWVRLKINN